MISKERPDRLINANAILEVNSLMLEPSELKDLSKKMQQRLKS